VEETCRFQSALAVPTSSLWPMSKIAQFSN
jgi:hypothetical protein